MPAGVTSATFDLYGAQGGAAGCSATSAHICSLPNTTAGLGAHVHGTMAVTSGQVFQIAVGGAAPGLGNESGGFNGGGGINAQSDFPSNPGGGGGASDVRVGGSLTDRILVAAGVATEAVPATRRQRPAESSSWRGFARGVARS